MPTAVQYAFHTGEWAPALNARVDQQKYRTGVALGENFFVDYRGGLSTRPGTKYIMQCLQSLLQNRLIPFQVSFSTGYILEFLEQRIRFYLNGAPVLTTALTITNITQANPAVVSVVNPYDVADFVLIDGVVGMTQVNGKYFRVIGRTAGTITLGDLNQQAIDSTGFGAYISGGTTRSIYWINSPYSAAELSSLKFKVNVDRMIIDHPAHESQELHVITATNWTISTIPYGPNVEPPASLTISSTGLGGGNVHYAYVVTAVLGNGSESAASNAAHFGPEADLRTTPGTISVQWSPSSGASAYNIYKADPVYGHGVVEGAAFGYAGTVRGTTFDDSNVEPNYDITPPINRNPFFGAGVVSISVTVPGVYTAVPSVTFDPPPSGITTATGNAFLSAQTATVSSSGTGYAVNDLIFMPNGVVLQVATLSGSGVATIQPFSDPDTDRGQILSGNAPTNPVPQSSSSGGGTGATFNFTWGVGGISIVSQGAGYTSAPDINFTPAGATAVAAIGPVTGGNPQVPAFFNQRLFQGALVGAPQSFYMSQPGIYYNFNVSDPIQPDDSISGSLVAGQLGEIKAAIPMQSGLIILTDTIAWLTNSGSNEAVTPINIVANPNSYVGANDVPPVVINNDAIYIQSKGYGVRNINYNFYNNQFTGKDISILSSHLFFEHEILEWAYADEPFKVVWAPRNDGVMLTLTFLPEQELIGWTHQTTDGNFKSVATVTELGIDGRFVDAVYTIVQRVVNGFTVQYIERFAERVFPDGKEDAWCVDAGLHYEGVPTASFSNAQHLAAKTVTGLADGEIITPFVMPTNGNFTLPAAASKVTVGLSFECVMKTLELDTGIPTIQGKEKKITSVNVKVNETLNLEIGHTLDTMVDMTDLIDGQVNRQDNRVVDGLYTGNALENMDPNWSVPGQYYIRQRDPYPASILGVFPEIVEEDIDK